MYIISLNLFIVIVLSIAAIIHAQTVSTISECPALSPRSSPAADVTDLRIDDFSIVAALGDSVMAGYAMMGVDYSPGGAGIMNFSAVSEFRGNSYGIGVDTDAVTIANFIKRYNPGIQGGSVLSRMMSYCKGDSCGILPIAAYRPFRDNLDAAQTGAMAKHLNFELDYLTIRMKTYSPSMLFTYGSKWKFITIQIGNNDQCAFCGPYKADVTPEAYGNYVEAAIVRIKEEMPRTVVNLIGTFKVSGVFPLADADQSYCVPNGILENRLRCSCANSIENMAAMDAVSDAYNEKLAAIAAKYSGKPGDTFAVMYRPAPMNMTSLPIDALR
ncbi:unnamed protein product [Mucor hiemalis]